MGKPLVSNVYYLKDYLPACPFMRAHARRAWNYQHNQLVEEQAFIDAGECICCGMQLAHKERK